jgi:hypothetical protein
MIYASDERSAIIKMFETTTIVIILFWKSMRWYYIGGMKRYTKKYRRESRGGLVPAACVWLVLDKEVNK